MSVPYARISLHIEFMSK